MSVLVATCSWASGQVSEGRLGELFGPVPQASSPQTPSPVAPASTPARPARGAVRLLMKDPRVRPVSAQESESSEAPGELPNVNSLEYDAPVPQPPQEPMLIELRPLPGEPTLPPDEEIIAGVPPALEPLPLDAPAAANGHVLRLNPLGVQQGLANLAVQGDNPVPRREMGFPLSVIPEHWGERLPRLSMQFSLPEGRHQGKGEPLVGTSWINRPLHVDLFTGGIFTGELVSGGAEATNGMLTGTRLGWDLNHYVGGELRLATGDTGISGTSQQLNIRFYDVSVLYYPWGDSRLRPFTTLGLGISQYTFVDGNLVPAKDTLMQMPFGLGFKYLLRPNLAMRMEFLDNLAFGSSFMRTQNNLSLTGGFELRIGGRRRNFYPFTSASRIW